MVQRYEVKAWGLPEPEMAEYAYGGYVEYDSYKELDDYYQERLADADKEIEGLVSRLAEINAELQKYKDQFPDYVECENCGSVTHEEGGVVMVQRFNAELERDGGLGLPCLTMRSSNIGEWVRYEDYAEMERKLRRLAKQVIDRQCNWTTYELAREILDL